MKKKIFAFCFCQNLVHTVDIWLLGSNYSLPNLKWWYVMWLFLNEKMKCLIKVSFILEFSFKQNVE